MPPHPAVRGYGQVRVLSRYLIHPAACGAMDADLVDPVIVGLAGSRCFMVISPITSDCVLNV